MSGLAERLKKALSKNVSVDWKPRPEILQCPQIPKPLHGVAPRVVLGQSWWNRERQAAYKSTNYHCIACEVHKSCAKGRQWLEGHEIYSIDYERGRSTYIETVPLCHYCHNFIHDGRLEALLDAGKIHHSKYVAIKLHGEEILLKHRLKPKEPHRGVCADWANWRLVIDGVEFPPLYKTFEEWLANMKKWNDE